LLTATSQFVTRRPRAAYSLAIGELYLLRSRRFHPRATAFFDKAADPDMSAGELLRFEACRRKITLISLQDRNGEILGPAPSKIHVDGGAALAHREHSAFHQRKAALLGQHIGGVIGVKQVIVRTGPKAKLGLSRQSFMTQKFHRTGAAADPGRHACMACCNQSCQRVQMAGLRRNGL